MQCMDKLDYRYHGSGWDSVHGYISRGDLHSYDVLFLAGGHVPTQRDFFEAIGLREKLQGFQGIIIGISAGSMNSADMVYIQPEEPGEAVDKGFCRWGRGLGLTKRNILPHYQMVKDNYLDGMRLYEDVTMPDSYGHEFIVLCDGSYLRIEAEEAGAPPISEEVYGEAYVIRDGNVSELCRHEKVSALKS